MLGPFAAVTDVFALDAPLAARRFSCKFDSLLSPPMIVPEERDPLGLKWRSRPGSIRRGRLMRRVSGIESQ